MKKTSLSFAVALILTGCTVFSKEKTGSHQKILVNTETTTIKKETPIEIVNITEFFDFGCSHCKTANANLKTLKEEFGKKINIEQKHFPLRPATFFAAEASECARKQDKFEIFKDTIFENFGVYTPQKMKEIAQKIGLNMEEFEICVKSGSAKQYVQAQVSEGEVLGINGTPFFLINNEIQIPGNLPIKTLKLLIQKILDGEKME